MRWWAVGFLAYLLLIAFILRVLRLIDRDPPEPPKWVNPAPRPVRDPPRMGHPPPELVNGNNEW